MTIDRPVLTDEEEAALVATGRPGLDRKITLAQIREKEIFADRQNAKTPRT